MIEGIFGKASDLITDFSLEYGFDDVITELKKFNGDDLVYLDDTGNVHLYESDENKIKKLLVTKEVLREFGVYDDTIGACEDIYNGYCKGNLRKSDGTLIPSYKVITRIEEIMESGK